MKSTHVETVWRPLRAARPLPRRPRPLAFCISAGAGPLAAGVLVLDATNVLSRAAADAKRWAGTPGVSVRSCFEHWLAFLVAAAGAPPSLVAVFDNPGKPKNKAGGEGSYLRRRRRRHQPTHASAAKLAPFLDAVEKFQGVSLIAEGGYEADECIGACCAVLRACDAAAAPRSLLIASGDADMQQHMGSHTSWLEILPLPTLEHPAGLAVTDAAAFTRVRGFPPAAYPDFLAFKGKREASISGVGVGATTAAKLVGRFGGAEAAVVAAAAGGLRGWGPAAEAALTTPATLSRLRSNLGVFRGESDAGKVLTAGQRAALEALAPGARPAAAPGARSLDDVAWLRPFLAVRWRQAGPVAARLAGQLEAAGAGPCRVRATAGPGVPVDILAGDRAVMVAAPCDFHGPPEEPGPPPPDLVAALAAAAPPRLADPCGVGRRLNRAAQQHISLLKKAGAPPVVVPWWAVPLPVESN